MVDGSRIPHPRPFLVDDVHYKVNLQPWNIRNGLLEWSDEKKIRETTKKG